MSPPRSTTPIGVLLGKRAAKHARKQARKRQRTAGGWRAPVPLRLPTMAPPRSRPRPTTSADPESRTERVQRGGIWGPGISERGCPSGTTSENTLPNWAHGHAKGSVKHGCA